ncbi:MAG: hypothetical protein ACXVBF_11780 [Flavisolibacter sp.]
MKKAFFLLTISSAVLFTACKKNKSETSTVNYLLQTQNASAGVVQWTAGTANVTSISFKGSSGNPLSTTINKSDDLFTSTAIGGVSVPVGSYTSPDYEVGLQAAGSASALHFVGNFNDGTSTVPVTLDISDNVTLKGLQNAMTSSNGAKYTATFSLDLNSMMQGIATSDLTAAEQNGAVVISSSSNANLYTTILTNISTGENLSFQIQ